MHLEDRDRRIDYVEFQTTDIDATKHFYTTVFGWDFTDWGPQYVSFTDGSMDGGFALSESVAEGGALVVLYALDLEELAGTIRQNGGRIVRDPFDFPGGRRFHFADPSGNELAVWSDR